MKAVKITQYKWAGKWGPFKTKQHCGECDVTSGLLKALMKKEFKGKPVTLEILPWLDNWYKPLIYGGWHAPIVMVNKKIVTQGKVVDRNKLIAMVEKALKE